MGKYKTFGSRFDRVHRNDLNANFAAVEADINAQKTRVDGLIVGTPQPSEVVDSRGGFPVLGDRLNDVASKLAQNTSQIAETATLVTGADKAGIIDSSDILQQAINTGRKVVLQKDATYLIEKPLYLKDNYQTIDCNGATIKMDASKGLPIFYIGAIDSIGTLTATSIMKPKIKNLRVTGFGNKVEGASGFHLKRASNVELESVVVWGMHSGLTGSEGNATLSQSLCNTFTNVDFRYNTYGIHDPLGDFQSSIFVNGRIEANELNGVYSRSNDIKFFGTTIEGNGTTVPSPEINYSGSFLGLNGCYMENKSTEPMIYTDGVTSRIHAFGCTVYGNSEQTKVFIKSASGTEQDFKIIGGVYRDFGQFISVTNQHLGINCTIMADDLSKSPAFNPLVGLENCSYYVVSRNRSNEVLTSGNFGAIGRYNNYFARSMYLSNADNSGKYIKIFCGTEYPWLSSLVFAPGDIYIMQNDTLYPRGQIYQLHGYDDTLETNWIKTLNTSNKMSTQANSVAADVAALKTDFNTLLGKLKAAGLMSY